MRSSRSGARLASVTGAALDALALMRLRGGAPDFRTNRAVSEQRATAGAPRPTTMWSRASNARGVHTTPDVTLDDTGAVWGCLGRHMLRRTNKVARLIAKGDEYLHAGDLDAAEALYRDALASDERSADAAWSIGCVASHRAEFEAALAWAQRALEIDSGHGGAGELAGNALLALERHEEALPHVRAAADRGSQVAAAQVALCLEALGRLEDAEACLRTLLESDPAYATRYASVAMYSHSPFWADAHHLLARVLQGLGNVEEARLHYHLAKRVDPETELDPRYLEIMSREDLEDHPAEEHRAGRIEDEGVPETDRVLAELVRATSYDELSAIAAASDRDVLLPQLTGIIEAAQVSGEYQVSARLRPIIDTVGGEDARRLFDALGTHQWRTLLSLAERAAAGRMSADEAAQVARAHGPPPFTDELLDLVRRFVALEPRSGLVLAQVVEGALGAASPRATLLVGRAQLGSGDAVHAEAMLRRALAGAEERSDDVLLRQVLSELSSAQRRLGDTVSAERTVRRSIKLAQQAGDRDHELTERYNLAALLYDAGRMDEAHALALEVAEAAAEGEGSASLATYVARLLDEAGDAVPRKLQAALRARTVDTAAALRERATRLVADGRHDDAVRLLQRARDEADAKGTRRDQAASYIELGRVLAASGRDAEARETLEHGLRRAEAEGELDRWPALMNLADVCARLGEPERAVEAAERALAYATHRGDREREAASHQQLAHLLRDTDPGGAVHHFGRFLRLGGDEPGDGPPEWTAGIAALEVGRYAEALEAFQALAAQPGRFRASSLANGARAQLALGDVEGAERSLRSAAAAFAEDGDPLQSLTALGELASLEDSFGGATGETIRLMREQFDALEAPHARRAGGLVLGSAALDAHDHDVAQAALLETVEVATSEEWADIDDEIEARRLLGTSYRRVGRNGDAREQYVIAIERALAVRDERSEGDLRGRLAIALRQLGRLEEAIEEYDRAIAIAARFGAAGEVAVNKMNRASALFELGRVRDGTAGGVDAWRGFEAQGNTRFALRTLLMLRQHAPADELPPEAAERLRGLFTDTEHNDAAVVMLSHRGAAQAAAGDIESAREDLTLALELVRGRGDRFEEVRALLNRARVLSDNDPDAAFADVHAAAALARSLGSGELEVDAYEAEADVALASGLLTELRDTLRALDRGWTVLRRRLSRDADRVALADRSAQGLKRCAAAFVDAHEDETAVAVLELARARAFGDLLAGLAGQADEPWPDPLDLAPARDLLAVLGPRAVALSLEIVEDHILATIMDAANPPRVEFADMTREELAGILDDFRSELIIYRGQAAQTWESRAASVLASSAAALDGADPIALLLDGPFHELPVHALPMPDGRRLIEHARIVHAPSLHALALMRRRPGLREDDPMNTVATVGVAFPDEARAISIRASGPCLSGRRIPKEQVHDVASRAKVLHFACHGFFDGETPLDSGLLLSTDMPPSLDDVLSVRDLDEWHLQSDLVVLSACETGLGRIAPSDFLGLARGFAAAGARSVIASLWPVDDLATQRLMLALYDDIQRQRDAGSRVNVAAALRAAQLGLADRPLHEWAAFKLIGWPEFAWTTRP